MVSIFKGIKYNKVSYKGGIKLKEFDIHHSMPRVEDAIYNLEMFLKISKSEKVIKIIHGYGSCGKGGKIKQACLETLEDKLLHHQIKAYIPGEAISTPMGYDDAIRKYKPLIQNDSDFHKGNDGITYVFNV